MSAGRRPQQSELELAATVSRQYFYNRKSLVQIADEFQISRFKVARLIELAREQGILTITIDTPGDIDGELSERLRRRFGLATAVVIRAAEGDEAVVREQLAVVTASLLREIVSPGDVIGLGWARTVLRTAALTVGLPACEVVQLTGALSRSDVKTNIVETVEQLARLGGGRSFSFYAPFVVSDPLAAQTIRRQPEAEAAFARVSSVTTALVGVGGWQPPSSVLYDALSSVERHMLLSHDVVADLSGTFLTSTGNGIAPHTLKQVIGISAAELKAVPNVVGIVYGAQKAQAVRVAVEGGYVKTLVTTESLARKLLAEDL